LFFCTFTVAIIGVPTILFFAIRSFHQGQRLFGWKQVTLASLITALPVLFFIYGNILLKHIAQQMLEEELRYVHAAPMQKY